MYRETTNTIAANYVGCIKVKISSSDIVRCVRVNTSCTEVETLLFLILTIFIIFNHHCIKHNTAENDVNVNLDQRDCLVEQIPISKFKKKLHRKT